DRLYTVARLHTDFAGSGVTPCEAEASCAALVKAGKVFATATENMDGLTFGTGVLLRQLTASEAKYYCTSYTTLIITYLFIPLYSICSITAIQFFIDLCVLLGCDYCGTIKGIGPKRAIDLIKHGSIEEILENIDPSKHPAPTLLTARLPATPISHHIHKLCRGCDEVCDSSFQVCNGCKKILKSRQGSTQGRLDTFFTITGSLSSKRKEPETKGSNKKKQKTGATPGK
uniref:Flap structure-specific endonuclease 1 n=1 Tax=Oncorhynchus kisutch TaxID=8019 RepID=A0A8C7HFM9_ONCKI